MKGQLPQRTATIVGDCPSCHTRGKQLLRHDDGSEHRYCYRCGYSWDEPC